MKGEGDRVRGGGGPGNYCSYLEGDENPYVAPGREGRVVSLSGPNEIGGSWSGATAWSRKKGKLRNWKSPFNWWRTSCRNWVRDMVERTYGAAAKSKEQVWGGRRSSPAAEREEQSAGARRPRRPKEKRAETNGQGLTKRHPRFWSALR